MKFALSVAANLVFFLAAWNLEAVIASESKVLLSSVPEEKLMDLRRRVEQGESAPAGQSLESEEKAYQALFQRHLFSELRTLYDPQSEIPVQVAFVSFTPESSKGGRDGGFGMHLVKRFRVPMGGGRERIVDINEQWPENKATGGLFYPNEIRVKIETFEGPAQVPGSERRYLFDAFNLAHGEKDDQVKICRRTKYQPAGAKTLYKQMRSRISAPFTCRNCHRPEIDLGKIYRRAAEAREYEAIVPDSYFARPAESSLGISAYRAYLRQRGEVPATIEKRIARLLESPRGPTIPGFAKAIEFAAANEPCWLGDDEALANIDEAMQLRQGVYSVRNQFFMEAIEQVFPGKYVRWNPREFVP